eukprot:5171166-Prymnesium_polylepis.1
MALVVLSGRPLYSGLSRLVRSLVPLAQQVMRMPVQKRTKELEVRVTKDANGLGLVMAPNNTIMQARSCDARRATSNAPAAPAAATQPAPHPASQPA